MSEKIQESSANTLSGWIALPLLLGFALWSGWSIMGPVIMRGSEPGIAGIFGVPLVFFLVKGFLVLEPNKAAVMTFFGKYAGSVRDDGFFWVNPFYNKTRVSLRAHNLTTPTLKVNDLAGNP
ncbi:MAG: SPFH domain-containing protein, partial [Gammaproteobacteria bacterium]